MAGILPPAGDAGLAHSCEAAATAHPRLVLATCILASSLAFVDGSVVNVGLPAIARSLAADAADLQWVINAYTLPLSALLLLGGALGDRFGRERLLVAGVGLFAAGSAACAFANGLSALLAARAAQGLGAALLLPSSLAVLGSAFEGPARARAVGLWAAASAAAAAIGPVLGGWLIDTVGWRAIFLINLPLAAAAIALTLAVVRDRRSASGTLDLGGAVLATGSLALLVWGLTLGTGARGWSAGAISAVVAGLGLAAAFVLVERRKGNRAMTPPALFGSRALVGLNLLTFLLYGALGLFLVLIPYVLIEAAGYPATAAGAALLPFPLIMAVGAPVMGALAGRFGPRGLLTAGAAVVAGGLQLGLRIDANGDYWTSVLPCVTAVALGMVAAAAPLTTAILSSVDEHHAGAASGLNSAVAHAGGLVATALVGGVLSARGASLVAAFHLAAVAASGTAALAAAIAFIALRPGTDTAPKPGRGGLRRTLQHR